ncbi:MAG: hypothetical protein C5B49_02995 [Bdellovibrio sp.]|nr:MAG: hypothetical protein C5B49_02995 [Bdellovibrio sp.]
MFVGRGLLKNVGKNFSYFKYSLIAGLGRLLLFSLLAGAVLGLRESADPIAGVIASVALAYVVNEAALYTGRSRRLRNFSAAITRSRQDGLPIEVPADSPEGLAGIARDFNSLTREMHETRERVYLYADELELKVSERTRELVDARQTIQAMVDSVKEGFLMFGLDGICKDVSSASCLTVLEGRPNGKHMREVLHLSEGESRSFDRWLGVLSAGKLPFADAVSLGPARYQHSKDRVIELRYYPLNDAAGKLQSVVLVATDRTEEIKAQREVKDRERRANFIVKASQMGQALENFLESADRDTSKLRLALANLHSEPLDLYYLTGVIHTIKGEASIFSLDEVTHQAHQVEEMIRSYATAKSVNLEQKMDDGIARLQELLLEARMFFYDITLRSGGPDLAVIREQRAKIIELITLMSELDIPEEFRNDLIKYGVAQQIGWFFKHYNQFVQDLAARLGKKVGAIEFENGDLPIYAEPYHEVFRNMVHLIRNALGHGIETPPERRAVDKPEAGSLKFSFERFPTVDRWFVRIVVGDDGRGIDVEQVRERLRKLKGDLFVEKKTDQEILQSIFDPGFSTKVEVSDISGRGVGLSSLKQECLALGGNIRVKSTRGQGTSFVIELPDSYDELINASTNASTKIAS